MQLLANMTVAMDEQSTRLLNQWRNGDESAAAELFHLYASRLLSVAERSMNQRVKRRVDGEDVVQSVFRSFFQRTRNDEYQIDGASELWRLLVKNTVNKARMKARFHSAERRDARSEEAVFVESLCRTPDAADAVAFMELIDVATEDLPEDHFEVLRMRMEGHSRTEIAKQLDVSRQHVYRVLATLQKRFLDQETV